MSSLIDWDRSIIKEKDPINAPFFLPRERGGDIDRIAELTGSIEVQRMKKLNSICIIDDEWLGR